MDNTQKIIEPANKPLCGVYKIVNNQKRDALLEKNTNGMGSNDKTFKKALHDAVKNKDYMLTYVSDDIKKLPLEPGDVVVSFDFPNLMDNAMFVEKNPVYESLCAKYPEGDYVYVKLPEGEQQAVPKDWLEISNQISVSDVFPLNRDELVNKEYQNYDLAHIREDKRTYDICMDIVRSDARALKHVPEKVKTKEMCEMAVEQDGRQLENVPYQFIDKAMCEMVVSEKNEGFGFTSVPEKFQDYDMCIKAVSYRGYNLDAVADKFKTQALCNLALSKNPWALQFTPPEFQTTQNVKTAVKMDGRVFKYADPALCTPEIISLALNEAEHLRDIGSKERIEFTVNDTTYGIYVDDDGLFGMGTQPADKHEYDKWKETDAGLIKEDIIERVREEQGKGCTEISEEIDKDVLIEAMEAAGYYYDEINSDSDLCFTYDKDFGAGSTRFDDWKEVNDWLNGVVFDDPIVSDKVEAILKGKAATKEANEYTIELKSGTSIKTNDEAIGKALSEGLLSDKIHTGTGKDIMGRSFSIDIKTDDIARIVDSKTNEVRYVSPDIPRDNIGIDDSIRR